MLKRALLVAAALIGAAVVWSQVASALSSRNPFGVPDIISPGGRDVMQLAERQQSQRAAGRQDLAARSDPSA
jgi:hypothetical protein